jgi:plasmid stabilization system protein ParE
MERYKIRILTAAQVDLIEIVEYLNTLSPEAAIRYYDTLTVAISGLGDMPERCPLVKDTNLQLRGYRFLPVENYTVFFVVIGKTVQIRRILYSRRQYQSLL